jgi:integrase
MRVSELRLVKIKDVNLDNGYVTVRNAKNHKDRVVPIHPDLVGRCVDLKETIHLDSSEDEYFFMIRPGQAMPLVNVYRNFRRYLDKADIPHTGHGPRVHDFRHTYCVNLLRKWVEEEKDLMAYMPYMKTILGHEGFEETAYYLKLTPEVFPSMRENLKSAFPDLIEEAFFEEREFY